MDNKQHTLTIPELSKALRISTRTAYRKVKTGEIPSIRVGNGIRILEGSLVQWIAAGGSRVSRPDGVRA